MKIGILAPPWLPVPPTSYGGIEAVVDLLVRGLAGRPHEVVLFTVGESSAPVTKRFSLEHAAVEQMGVAAVELPHVAEGYAALSDCDVIHDHTLVGPAWGLGLTGRRSTRIVTTCHEPLDGPLREVYRVYAERVPVIAISRDQAARAPEVRVAQVIHHGIDAQAYPQGQGQGGYLLFLGRMTPDKGAAESVHVARAAGLPLKLAAKMRHPFEKEYFASEVEPLLGNGCEYVGEVDLPDKLALLGDALALLNPIDWPEPFGLVMLEALACGTPVITYARGAAPEIVDDGKTGFLCTERAGLVQAVAQVDELDRRACRAAAIERFSPEAMVAAYLELYEQAAAT